MIQRNITSSRKRQDAPCNKCEHNCSFLGNVFKADKKLGEGFVEEIRFKDFTISYGDMQLLDNRIIHFKQDVASVKMIFQFCGDITINLSGLDDELQLTCNHHALLYTRQATDSLKFYGCDNQKFLYISFEPEAVIPYFPDHHLFQSFLGNIHSGVGSSLTAAPKRITFKMQQILDEIFETKREGALKQLFLETKAKELLLLQIEQFIKPTYESTFNVQKHADKIYQAKTIIEENIGKPCSLIDLAHQVGTNECTLKKGFKEVMDTTVFSYWNDLKMQKAYKMLLESDASVTDIAIDSGFKSSQHFITSFKKKYGTTPGKIRTQNIPV